MRSSVLRKKKILKCGFTIKCLTVISLICTILGCVSYFLDYDYEKINGEYVYEEVFSFPYFIEIVELLCTITPVIIFTVYIFKYYKKLKATILFPIIWGLFSFRIFIGYFFSFLFGYGYGLISFIINIPFFILSILGVISSLQGFRKKIFIIIAIILGLLSNIESFIRFFYSMSFYVEYFMYLTLLTSIFSIIGVLSLFIALLLFVIKNKIPSIIYTSKKKKSNNQINPEKELKYLKERFELGMISEDEYKKSRSNIINQL